MSIKYPTSFVGIYTDSPNKTDGSLTALATEWAFHLDKLSYNDIKTGIANCNTRAEKRFPPTAMEFYDLCKNNEYEDVVDAILCKLQDNDYQFKNRLAYTVYAKNSFDFKTAKITAIEQIVKKQIRITDKNKLHQLPVLKSQRIEPILNREVTHFRAILTNIFIRAGKPMPKKIENDMNNGTIRVMYNDFLAKGFKLIIKKNQSWRDQKKQNTDIDDNREAVSAYLELQNKCY